MSESVVDRSRRVAIVDGVRTPFAKAGGVLREADTLALGQAVVGELLARAPVDRQFIEKVVFGSVIQDPSSPNIAREIVLACDMPQTVDAYSVTRACATSSQSFISGALAILTGEADIVVTGGSDSLSNPPVMFSDEFVKVMMDAQAASDPLASAKALSKLRPRDLAPNPPAIAERSTGESMGQSAERMARMNRISRQRQDEYAVESHRKAVEAWEKGVYAGEVMTLAVPPSAKDVVARDTIPRSDTSLERLAELDPVFDRRYGTITAGNASPLTDGAAALLLMEESAAKRHGLVPKAFLRAWSFVAVDPSWQLLIGPALAIPKVLDRAGMSLDEIDVFDVHEAFAAQVLSVLDALASDEFAERHLGRDGAVGVLDEDKLNLYGGSLSLGHPFGATGARQLLTMANELERRDRGTAVVTQCAAGGLGAAIVLER